MAKLKILTWNIWMMPSLPLVKALSPKNEARAAAIAAELSKRDFDIIVFEKAFDGAAREVLRNNLGQTYKYRYGPLNDDPGKLNGGVWVLSKLPLTLVREIEYRDYVLLFEGLSRKGAMLLSGYADDGKPFEIIGTHLQGESGAGNEHQKIRDKQIAQLASELVSQSDPKIPLFICGDFNTQRREPSNPAVESPSYLRMLQLFHAVNGHADRVTLDRRTQENDLAEYNDGRQAELDYILVRPGETALQGIWEVVHFTHPGWDGPNGRKDLSYRFAICGQFEF